ncbi:hypothetical protein DEI93_07105 [Curtobacterium sp. MCBD17_035]|uniref:hypothetical protein n=1 Tax=Curtobacterium sp. MCBD17_035 TaxID=2175673 RepID=UPI000DA8B93E|nr:hypothetical protein [Curtobacterium sp. MCBD17_035]WIB68789.1 hypothetical protein DEI93_07105 [Curtobacterium sp. MCBD17_035]
MSDLASWIAWDYPKDDLSSGQGLALLALAQESVETDGRFIATTTYARLSRLTGLSTGALRKSLRVLEQRRLIRRGPIRVANSRNALGLVYLDFAEVDDA